MEKKSCYVKDGPFGESLFAKKDFARGDIISYYNGLWLKEEDVTWGKIKSWKNMTSNEM